MSVTCTFYRVEDKWIDLLIQLPTEVDNWINQIDKWVERGTVENRIYHLDSAWDIAQFLLNECDKSTVKVLKRVIRAAHCLTEDRQKTHNSRYLRSDEVKMICQELEKINEEEPKEKWNQEKMLKARVYRSNRFTQQEDWRYIMEHIATIRKAFREASENNHGLICRIEL